MPWPHEDPRRDSVAGSDHAGVCYQIRTYLTKIREGQIEDESVFGIIYTIDDGDNPFDPNIWGKANPNLGVSVKFADFSRLAAKARETPAAVNSFLTKRLHVWVNADIAWMEMAAWDRCARAGLKRSDFAGRQCVLAVDLATRRDLAALVQVFDVQDLETLPFDYAAFAKFYLPEAAIEASNNSQYSGWVREGRIVTTPGNTTDFHFIQDDARELASQFQILEFAFDPWQAAQFSTELLGEGFPMVEMGATVKNFSEPMKELDALVVNGKLGHDGDPVLGWNVSNVVAHMDAKDNIFPKKERPEKKIDGAVALIMALGRLLLRPEPESSVYTKDRGILVIG